eukprot:scaffold222139_cov30-Tisochrysis_lutea.AAC.1
MNGSTPVADLVAWISAQIDEQGIDCLRPGWRLGNLSRPRPLELAAAINRLRSLLIPLRV